MHFQNPHYKVLHEGSKIIQTNPKICRLKKTNKHAVEDIEIKTEIKDSSKKIQVKSGKALWF